MRIFQFYSLPYTAVRSRGIKLHVYGKRQMSDSTWEFLKIENEQIKTAQTNLMDKKLRATTE